MGGLSQTQQSEHNYSVIRHLGGMMMHPEHLSCRAGTGTAGDGLACLGVADSFAGVAGAVMAAFDKGADGLSDIAGVT